MLAPFHPQDAWREHGVTVLHIGDRQPVDPLSAGARSTRSAAGGVPDERIAWDGRGLFLDVYHAWLIESRQGGCWVTTEENQNGFAARVQRVLMPGRMYRGHELWLTRLKARAEQGLPPGLTTLAEPPQG